jgi:hypothetical protein
MQAVREQIAQNRRGGPVMQLRQVVLLSEAQRSVQFCEVFQAAALLLECGLGRFAGADLRVELANGCFGFRITLKTAVR